MALNAEQYKLRQVVIDEYCELLSVSQDPTIVLEALKTKELTEALVTSILSQAIAEGSLRASQVPVKLIPATRKKWIKLAGDRERNKRAKLGTAVHDVFERLANGEVFDIPEQYESHAEMFLKFVEKYQVRFVKTEFVVFNLTYGYAGTGDFLAYFDARPEWGLILGDYKSSLSGIWPSVALQLAGLRYGDFIGDCTACPCPNNDHPTASLVEDYETLKRVEKCVGVQITADKVHVVPSNVNPFTFEVFKAACIVADWKLEGERFAIDKKAEDPIERETVSE